MSKLEKKWWFAGAVSLVTALVTSPLLDSAGLLPITGFAQGLVGVICFYAVFRLLSALGRLITVLAFPSSRLLD
jgi:hypothetical protein